MLGIGVYQRGLTEPVFDVLLGLRTLKIIPRETGEQGEKVQKRVSRVASYL